MELYLDSANLKEIEEAFELGFLSGLTTTPTFMHRDGITDIDGTIMKLSEMVPVLQIEALGETKEDICTEAHRLLELGLDKTKSVFKIPVSLEGVKACKALRNEDIMVNIHLVYTMQQAYMALEAGANYVCPLVGRLQDQGHDALALVQQAVEAVNYYGYDSKIMFSSVRHAEHVRNAINIGVHTCTVPWKVMKKLTENNFTTVGTDQFFAHTRLMTLKVNDIIKSNNPTITQDATILQAIVKMTESGFGAVSVVDNSGDLIGAFTDGDLRRELKNNGELVLQNKMSSLQYKMPVTINANALLNDAMAIFSETKVDNIIVTENKKPIGILDIQDMVKLNIA